MLESLCFDWLCRLHKTHSRNSKTNSFLVCQYYSGQKLAKVAMSTQRPERATWYPCQAVQHTLAMALPGTVWPAWKALLSISNTVPASAEKQAPATNSPSLTPPLPSPPLGALCCRLCGVETVSTTALHKAKLMQHTTCACNLIPFKRPSL